MSESVFDCPHCQQHLSGAESMAEIEVLCPNCTGKFIVPKLKGSHSPPSVIEEGGACPYCRTLIQLTDQRHVCESCSASHHAECWDENGGCTVYGCSEAPQEGERIVITSDTTNNESEELPKESQLLSTTSPMFFYIPVGRLMAMSIFSCGVFDAYWIYKNWCYLKERDGLNISPFWRAWFAVFTCYGTLKAIRTDHQMNEIEKPSYSAGGLTTGWIIFSFITKKTIFFFIPGSLFLIPVQNYINRVNESIHPRPQHMPWTTGHFVCLLVGAFFWIIPIVALVSR
jgi:hypothetical protein